MRFQTKIKKIIKLKLSKRFIFTIAIILVIGLSIIALINKGVIYHAAIPQEATPTYSVDFGTIFVLPDPLEVTAERFSLVIPSPYRANKIPQIRASIPDIMLPFNSFYVDPQDIQINSIPWETIVANGWKLTDVTKREYNITFNFADPGAPGYAEAWADAAIVQTKASGANWVFADSINANLSWTFPSHERPEKYPTEESWREAMRHFLEVVSKKVHDAGLKFSANMSGSVLAKPPPAGTEDWRQFVDAPLVEFFSFNRDFTQSAEEYSPPVINYSTSTIEQQINLTQNLNKPIILDAPGRQDDPLYDQRARFSLAMYLIARKQGDWFIFHNARSPGGNETVTFWHPDFAAAKNLGNIVSAPTKTGNIWYRKYEKAIVLLNATDENQSILPNIGQEAAALGTLAARTGLIVNLKTTNPTPKPTATSEDADLTPSPSSALEIIPSEESSNIPPDSTASNPTNTNNLQPTGPTNRTIRPTVSPTANFPNNDSETNPKASTQKQRTAASKSAKIAAWILTVIGLILLGFIIWKSLNEGKRK